MSSRPDRIVEWVREAVDGDNPAVPAATVVLLRDGATGVEALMVRKDSEVAFGGMWVFPGGRVDEGDRGAGGDRGGDGDIAAARRAAVREAHEECGLAVSEGALEWLSFWVPPPQAPRRFATWFFVAPAPEGAVTIDDGEIREHRWLSAEEALRLRDGGEIELAPPTWVTLHWIGEHGSVDDAMEAARQATPERFETRLAPVDGGAVALWEGDAGYEPRDPNAPGPRHRLWLLESGWRYERSSPPG